MKASFARRWLIESTIIGLAYFGAAYVVVHTRLGYANANLLWLPAGIALGVVLLYGARTLPAILLAAFLFNSYPFFSASEVSAAIYAAALITAIGCAMQAGLTAGLLQNRLKSLHVTSVAGALRFLFYSAIGCTIAASIGTLTQLQQGRLDSNAALLNWLTWWVGDLTGVLVVTPLLLMLHGWRRGRLEWSQFSLPIIGIGLSFTLVAAFIVKNLDNTVSRDAFNTSGIAMGRVLQRNLDLSLRDLMALQAVFYNISLTPEEFKHFSDPIVLVNPLIRSLSWLPKVSAAQRSAFEGGQRQRQADFRIYELGSDNRPQTAAPRAEYFPVQMIVPEQENKSVIGFDVLSGAVRADTIQLARKTGEVKATAQVKLVQGGSAILLYWPVYSNEFRYPNKTGRDQDLRGLVAMAIEIRRLAEESLHPFEYRNAETWLIDISTLSKPQLLYHHVDGNTPTRALLPDLSELRRGTYVETHHEFAGRDWLLISHPARGMGGFSASGEFFGILLGGAGFTFLLAFYMVGRQRNESIMHARDERLLSQNAVLTQLAHNALSTETKSDDELRQLAAAAAVTLKVERVSIWLLDQSVTQMACHCLFTRSTGEYSDGLVLKASDYPRYFATLQEGRGFAADDAQHDPRTSEFAAGYLRPLGITALLDVPIRIGNRLAGVVCHEHVGTARKWAPDEQTFAASIGDLASLVLEEQKRIEAEQALQKSYAELEHKVAERTEELCDANERLRQLDQLKTMFIASMSHELRTPLNSIIGFTGVILQGISGALTDRQKDQLTRVYGSATHLLALITDVIDISKIEAGYVEVYPEAFSLTNLIEEALASLQTQRLEKGIELDCDCEKIRVTTDRKRLLQCVLNLLSNAVKYTERGVISVRTRSQPDRILIEVADTGIGIAPAAMQKLFQPFERIDTHLRIKTPGTGLGLYLSQKIAVDLLHGGLSATSTAGEGSVFTLWIPHSLSTDAEN